MGDVPDLVLIAIAAITVIISALLSAGEAALARITRNSAAEIASSGRRNGALIVRLVSDPGQIIASASFFRVVSEMTTAVCLTLVIYSTVQEWWLAFIIAVVASVLVSLVLVGTSPRSLGRMHPQTTLVWLSPMLRALDLVLHPAYWISNRVRPQQPARRRSVAASAIDLRDMVDRVSESEQIEEAEREMLHSIIELGETLTREVMVPRTEVVTVQAGTPLLKAQSLFLRSGFSRVPVIGDSVDDLLGMLYFKDVVRRIVADPQGRHEDVRTIMRSAVFVPDTKPVDDLLSQLQAETTHIAMVVDEYGGIAGLVTIEDAIEEIVGELTDEHDHSVRDVVELDDGQFRVPSRLSIDDLGELFGLDVEDEDVDSTGGLLAKALGKVPIPGAAADVQGIHLIAERTEGRRKQIATILASRMLADDDFDSEEATI